MDIYDKVSTGLKGLDQVIDELRLGDNVVWQVDSVASYKKMVEPYVAQAKLDNRKLVYVRFGSHKPILEENENVHIYNLEAEKGFESFATAVHNLMEQEGRKTFYVFDCLTDLLKYWYSDSMIGNFFKITCPFLYELDTVAYFALIRNAHTYNTIASIRETTQLLLDLYEVKHKFYVHPLKVENRYSPTMFFPHLIEGQTAKCITASSEAAELFSTINRGEERLDYWDVLINKAKDVLKLGTAEQEKTKSLLMSMIIGTKSRMFELCDQYFTLNDILAIASREVGTGYIGGKSVGMLLARKILEIEGEKYFQPFLEPHDSFYIGADVYYSFIVQNGWWKLRMKQKTKEGYYKYAPELKEKILKGKFPENIREQFLQMLEYFGQSPIIVRSSSLLEDNFGNAFAGKYESVFCVNQGTPEERYAAFENAIRTVYASTMDRDALVYRMNRGLFEKDEQMALLVQRVSGDHYGENFFPHLAGVGNSTNLYVWDKDIDMEAGMLRLVFGLGTRAVDRTVDDYAKIVTLDNPSRVPLVDYEDEKRFSQNFVDILSLRENILTYKKVEDIIKSDLKVNKKLFASFDYRTANRLRELGYNNVVPYILDFKELLTKTQFPIIMRKMLKLLSRVYKYPVDIEFTANFKENNQFKINLLQCRPLQTRGIGKPVKMPKLKNNQDCFIFSKGNFMGGNIRLPIDYVVFVRGESYLKLSTQEKYSIARQIGDINDKFKGQNLMLVGPGRWGTSTPSLGVPVRFAEICNMSVLCEVASNEEGFIPELSYGSHFFQDIVETGIFYAAVFGDQKDVIFNPNYILDKENLLPVIFPHNKQFSNVIYLIKSEGLEIFADIVTQILICK